MEPVTAAGIKSGYAPISRNLYPETRYAENLYPEARYAENLYPETRYAENLYPETRCAENLYPETRYADIYILVQTRFEQRKVLQEWSMKSILGGKATDKNCFSRTRL